MMGLCVLNRFVSLSVYATTKRLRTTLRSKTARDYRLKEISGDTVELNVTIKPTEAKNYGVKVFCDKRQPEWDGDLLLSRREDDFGG